MVSGIEGVGEAVTGGILARTVEPGAGDQGDEPRGNCLNCGAEPAGPYCHRCGQKGQVHRTLGAFWHDLLHGVLHFEGKIWRTLPLLAWKPGELTRRYIAGERANFVSPIALFLFSVFLMFAVFSISGASMIGIDAPEASRDVETELTRNREALARLEAQRRTARREQAAALDRRIAAARRRTQELETARSVMRGEPVIGANIGTGWARLDEGIRKANENPALLFYKVQTNAYKFSWALIPISVPFLWLLFLHRGRYRRTYRAYDHVVFVTYSIAFMSLWMIAFFLLRMIGLGGGLLNVMFILVPPVHIYRQLRGAYGLSRFSALWRSGALLVFAGVAMTLFLLLLFAIGVLG